MTLRIHSLTAAILTGLFASGCAGGPGLGQGSTVVLTHEIPGVAVDGLGKVMATPDVAIVTLGVEAHGQTVAEARERAAQAAKALGRALENDRVAAEDVQTSYLSIQPQYNYGADGTSRIVGYAASNQLTVKVRELAALSRTIDDAVAAAGDAARLQGIQFDIDDPSTLRAEARDKAVAEARKKAEQLAKLAGVELGAPISIEEIAYASPSFPGRFYGAAEAGASTSTPIEPGQSEVAIQVRVRWAIGS